MTRTPASPVTLRSFWHDLPREGRLLLSVVVVQFVGTGLVLPFLVVYLHEVRGFSLGDVGMLIGLGPLLGFVAVGPGGAVIDRYGARVVMLFAVCVEVLADIALTFASVLPIAVAALALQGIAFGIEWPAAQSLVATVIPSGLRQRYFGVNFTLLNLGIGLGGILGGLVVDVHHPVTFQAIYIADAASFLPAIYLLSVPLRHVSARRERDTEPQPA